MGPVVDRLTAALDPLRAAAVDPDLLRVLVARADPTMVMDQATASALQTAMVGIPNRVDTIADAAVQVTEGDLSAVPTVAAEVALLVDDLLVATEAITSGDFGLQPPYDSVGYWTDLAADLVLVLVADLIADTLAPLHGLLVGVGVIEYLPGGGIRLDVDRLGDLLDPATVLGELSGWAVGQFDVDWIVERMEQVVGGAGLSGRVVEPGPEIADLVGVEQPPSAAAIEIPFVSGLLPGGAGMVDLGLIAAVVATTSGGHPDALLLTNLSFGEVGVDTPLTDDGWSITATGNAEATARLGALWSPSGVELISADTETEFGVEVVGHRPGLPFRPIGQATGTRMEIDRIVLAAELMTEGSQADAAVRAALEGGVFVLSAGDSLLQTLLGGSEIDVPFDLEARWSPQDGFTLSGSAGLSLDLPLSVAVGPVLIDGLEVGLGPAGGGVELFGRIGLSSVLGPFAAVVDGAGAAVAAVPAAAGDSGLFAGLDVTVTILAPRSIGFTIEAPLTTGGGFVHIDPANGRYAGGLAVDVAAVGISAFVVVDTAVPEVPSGWAFFASLGARFPSVPLAFGFTLNGVGGILAINRTMDAEALAASLRAGSADAILFPDDPEADAPLLMNAIDHLFPVDHGSTVIGPVVEIGWGAPTLITAQLGVVVSIPDGVVAVLGSIETILPTVEAPALVLHLDALGVVDVAAGTVTVTASLYDSHLLGTIHLSGDMAAHVEISGQPWFMISVGGFHPGFCPPSQTPMTFYGLRRMTAAISLGTGVSVTIESYVALTSNSLQFGSHTHLIASIDFLLVNYTAEGWFGFDVLLEFNPFSFSASLSAGVTISAGGNELLGVWFGGLLEGPDPWHVVGRAQFNFFGIDVPFEIEFGDEDRETLALPVFDVLAALIEALENIESWEIVPIDDQNGAAVSLTGNDGELILSPDDGLLVRQSVVPLEQDIDRVGHLVPSVHRVDIDGVGLQVDGEDEPLDDWDRVEDWFAPAHYFHLPPEEQLGAPPYELMTAGVTFTNPGIAVPEDLGAAACTAPEGYEEVTADGGTDVSLRWQPDLGVLLSRPPAVAAPTFGIRSTGYTVVGIDDGVVAADVLTDSGHRPGAALDHAAAVRLVEQQAATTGRRGRLRIVPWSATLDPADRSSLEPAS